MRVVVTGGTGYLGRAIVTALAARGHDPVVFARRASSSRLPGTPVDGDVRDREALRTAARGCEAICHVAAMVSIWHRNPQVFDEINVDGTRTVLAVARESGLGLVYTSTFLARPPRGRTTPLVANDYQRTKAAALEHVAQAAGEGLSVVCLYPGVVYGPGIRSEGNLMTRMISDHLARRLPGLVGADRIWSYAFVDDVAAAHVAAVERGAPGAHYGLGGENVPQIRPFEILRELTGRQVPRRLPYLVATLAGMAEEGRARLTGATPLLTRATVEIFRHDWPVDSGEAERDLGYRITPLREGVGRLLADLGWTGWPMSAA
jgi:farnesol dehydrogenase